MNDNDLEQTLNEELKNLKQEMAPDRDLWPGIDHAINANTVTLPKPVAIAAGVLLCVSLAFSGGLYVSRPQTDNQNQDIAGLISVLQSEHERNKQALLVEYQDQTALAPDWESQMDQLEQAEEAIYEALREEPGNVELLKILRQVQNKQIDLIESVYAPLFTTI